MAVIDKFNVDKLNINKYKKLYERVQREIAIRREQSEKIKELTDLELTNSGELDATKISKSWPLLVEAVLQINDCPTLLSRYKDGNENTPTNLADVFLIQDIDVIYEKLFESKSYNSFWNCRGACVGFCTANSANNPTPPIEQSKFRLLKTVNRAAESCISCTAECAVACVSSCKFTCQGNCSGDCTNGCKMSCLGGCSDSCLSACGSASAPGSDWHGENAVAPTNCEKCSASCVGGCIGNCTNNCEVGCVGQCLGMCTSCSWSCGGCDNSCSWSCGYGCEIDCSGQCNTGCRYECKNQCGFNCSSQCYGTCQGSCGGNCRSTSISTTFVIPTN